MLGIFPEQPVIGHRESSGTPERAGNMKTRRATEDRILTRLRIPAPVLPLRTVSQATGEVKAATGRAVAPIILPEGRMDSRTCVLGPRASLVRIKSKDMEGGETKVVMARDHRPTLTGKRVVIATKTKSRRRGEKDTDTGTTRTVVDRFKTRQCISTS